MHCVKSKMSPLEAPRGVSHARVRWRSRYDAEVCTQCHPPADAALVAAWAGEA
jgi:hypothetical protein